MIEFIKNCYRKIFFTILFPLYISLFGLISPLNIILKNNQKFNKATSDLWLLGSLIIMKLMFIKSIKLHYNPEILNKNRCILISNHVNYLDWYVIMLGLLKLKKSNIFFNTKKSLSFASSFFRKFNKNKINFIFLKRSLNYDYITLVNSCKKLKTFEDFTTVLFPEGTLFTRKKSSLINIKRSATRNVPTPKNVMTPKTKGFSIILENLKGNLDAVIDCTILYSNKTNIKNLMKGNRSEIHIYLDYNGIPEKNYEDWLIDKFQQKDKLLDYGSCKLMKSNYLTIEIDLSKKTKNLIFLLIPYFIEKLNVLGRVFKK